jgi:hypothetical protein
MSAFETSATVQNQGRVIVVGVPFAPGTEVAVSITPRLQSTAEVTPPDKDALDAARDRMRELFGSVTGFRNAPRIAREELYERGSLH